MAELVHNMTFSLREKVPEGRMRALATYEF
jgi:hypothetical protein